MALVPSSIAGAVFRQALKTQNAVVKEVYGIPSVRSHFVVVLSVHPEEQRVPIFWGGPPPPPPVSLPMVKIPFLAMMDGEKVRRVISLVEVGDSYQRFNVQYANLVGKGTHQLIVYQSDSSGNSANSAHVRVFHWTGKRYERALSESVQAWGANMQSPSGQLSYKPRTHTFLVQGSDHVYRNWFQDEFRYPVPIPPIVEFEPAKAYRWNGHKWKEQTSKDTSILKEWFALQRAIASWYLGDDTQLDMIVRAATHQNMELAYDALRVFHRGEARYDLFTSHEVYRRGVEKFLRGYSR